VPNLAFELRRLTATNVYIRDAEARITHIRARSQRETELEVDVSFVESALQSMAERLELFLHHRSMIEQTIEEIRSTGSLA
jgi:hypothetical protein